MSERTLNIKVIPDSKLNKIIEQSGDFFKIKLTAPAHENKANQALIAFLSQHFKIAKNKIQIVSGSQSREKNIKILS